MMWKTWENTTFLCDSHNGCRIRRFNVVAIYGLQLADKCKWCLLFFLKMKTPFNDWRICLLVSFCVHVCVLQHFRQLATGKTRCCSLRCFYLFFNIWDVCWFLYECMCQKGLQWLNVIMDRQPTEALNVHTKSIKFMYISWLNYVFIPYMVFQQEVLFWYWQKNAIF